MTNTEIILSSTVIATICSVLITSFVSYQLRKLDYKNEYYKKIIDKRLEAYKYTEKVIAMLKTTAMDMSDGKAYHLLLDSEENLKIEFQRNLMSAINYSIWINDSTVDILTEINKLFFYIDSEDKNTSLIVLGKRYYNDISIQRKLLEQAVKNDLTNLHNTKHFKKNIDLEGMNSL